MGERRGHVVVEIEYCVGGIGLLLELFCGTYQYTGIGWGHAVWRQGISFEEGLFLQQNKK